MKTNLTTQPKRGRKPLPAEQKRVPVSARISYKAWFKMTKEEAEAKLGHGEYLSRVIERHRVKLMG